MKSIGPRLFLSRQSVSDASANTAKSVFFIGCVMATSLIDMFFCDCFSFLNAIIKSNGCSMADRAAECLHQFVEIVEENEKMHSARDIQRAKIARNAFQVAGSPSMQDFMYMICSKD